MPVVVAIVGDSFVSRFQDYCVREGLPNLNFGSETVSFIGRGGAVVRGRKPVLPLLTRAIRLNGLRVLYLNIGSNDLCDPNCSPDRLGHDIVCLAKYALASSDQLKVVIGQIHPRSRAPLQDYNRRVWEANSAIMRHSRDVSRLHFAHLKGLSRISSRTVSTSAIEASANSTADEGCNR